MSKSKTKPPVAEKSTPTPAGVIRRGQRRPYRKSTNEEMEQRISEVADFIASKPFIHNGEIKAWIKDTYGIDWWQANLYIKRARLLIAKRSKITKAEAKDLVVNFLFNTMRDGTKGEALKASEQVAKVFGLEAPKNLRLGDPDGKPMAPAVVAPTVVFNIPNNHRDKNGK